MIKKITAAIVTAVEIFLMASCAEKTQNADHLNEAVYDADYKALKPEFSDIAGKVSGYFTDKKSENGDLITFDIEDLNVDPNECDHKGVKLFRPIDCELAF